MKRWIVLSALCLLVGSGVLVLDSCRKGQFSPPVTPLAFPVPPGFPQPVYDFRGNPLTNEGFLLGRKLFYDGRLSIDGNFPCASCHQPVAAFTTFEHDRSHGYNHSHTLRNAPGLFNLAWYPVFNQDGGGGSLEAIYRRHITDPHEMAEDINHVVGKLKADPTYRQMFQAAFGSDGIDAGRIYKALDQFVVSLVSASSKYDRVKAGTESFTATEAAGYATFQAKCAVCHTEPLFTDFQFHNTGLEVDPLLNDYGRMRITGRSSDSLKFRTPSLRNNDFTSYYGHDGRFNLPRAVLLHYENGVQAGPTTDPLLSGGIALTLAEEDNLVFFLRTLSDSSFLNNPRFKE